MRLKDRQSNKKNETMGVVVGPEDFPQSKDIIEWELPLERDKDPAGGKGLVVIRKMTRT